MQDVTIRHNPERQRFEVLTGGNAKNIRPVTLDPAELPCLD
ncbi:hypothetical protein ABIB17_001181 [Arthrobacter sp. UYEF6]